MVRHFGHMADCIGQDSYIHASLPQGTCNCSTWTLFREIYKKVMDSFLLFIHLRVLRHYIMLFRMFFIFMQQQCFFQVSRSLVQVSQLPDQDACSPRQAARNEISTSIHTISSSSEVWQIQFFINRYNRRIYTKGYLISSLPRLNRHAAT